MSLLFRRDKRTVINDKLKSMESDFVAEANAIVRNNQKYVNRAKRLPVVTSAAGFIALAIATFTALMSLPTSLTFSSLGLALFLTSVFLNRVILNIRDKEITKEIAKCRSGQLLLFGVLSR